MFSVSDTTLKSKAMKRTSGLVERLSVDTQMLLAKKLFFRNSANEKNEWTCVMACAYRGHDNFPVAFGWLWQKANPKGSS